MQIEKTARGFAIHQFTDRNGEACSIQESSSLVVDDDAGGSMLWLGVDETVPQVRVENEGWAPVPLPDGALIASRMHLTQQHVWDLLPLLTHFAEHGRLPEGETE